MDIKIKNYLYPEDFIKNFLVSFIYTIAMEKVDLKKLKSFEADLINNYGLDYTIDKFYKYAFSNLSWKKFSNSWIIEINSNKTAGSKKTKLISICKYINFGSINKRAYPIFTEIFKYIENNIDSIYTLYLMAKK